MSFCRILLKSSRFRRSLITHLKSDYYHEIDNSLPLRNGFWAHILENDSYTSFSEIFILKEYESFLPKANISKIIDIGANYGFFSLWIQSNTSKDTISSLLIEPSFRCKRSLDKLVSQPRLKNQFKYLQRVISNPKTKEVDFYERPFMASSSFRVNDKEISSSVKTLQEKEIYSKLKPPFDLIKCDIEGSEWEFLKYYQKTIKNTKFLLLEWHSWHNGGGSIDQITEMLYHLNFKILKSSESFVAEGRDGFVGLILAQNNRP